MAQTADSLSMAVLCFGATSMLCRPCVDCGQYTGRFCDYCEASDRIPSEQWAYRQLTPLCSACDWCYHMCHYCRGVHSARPFAWGVQAVDEPEPS